MITIGFPDVKWVESYVGFPTRRHSLFIKPPSTTAHARHMAKYRMWSVTITCLAFSHITFNLFERNGCGSLILRCRPPSSSAKLSKLMTEIIIIMKQLIRLKENMLLLLSSTAHMRRVSAVVKTSMWKQTNVNTSQLLPSMLKHYTTTPPSSSWEFCIKVVKTKIGNKQM